MEIRHLIFELQQVINRLEQRKNNISKEILSLNSAIETLRVQVGNIEGEKISTNSSSQNISTAFHKIIMGTERRKTAIENILDVLKDKQIPMRPEEIQEELRRRNIDISPATLHVHLSRAHRDESIPLTREGYGSYIYTPQKNSRYIISAGTTAIGNITTGRTSGDIRLQQ